jgi:hypothetical protein
MLFSSTGTCLIAGDFGTVWLTVKAIIGSRPDLITVVVIPYVFDEFQSARLFVVAVSLSHTPSWVTGIVRRVSFKDRVGCVDWSFDSGRRTRSPLLGLHCCNCGSL